VRQNSLEGRQTFLRLDGGEYIELPSHPQPLVDQEIRDKKPNI